jgi:hypothetical protein
VTMTRRQFSATSRSLIKSCSGVTLYRLESQSRVPSFEPRRFDFIFVISSKRRPFNHRGDRDAFQSHDQGRDRAHSQPILGQREDQHPDHTR